MSIISHAHPALVVMALFVIVPASGASQSNACATIAPTAPISAIGAFSNLRETEEHAYGETVWLWRSGGCVFGLFESAQGLQGDAPIGELQDVMHNPRTGELRFTASLSIGILYGGALTSPRPSRDRFSFVGTLSATRLAGELSHATQADAKPTVRAVTLAASARDADFLSGPATYGVWREIWDPILARRGPK
jgi:hypothetical protein